MNIPRLILTIIVTAVVIYLFDFLYHGIMLGQSYKDTAEAWRTEEEMMKRIPLQAACYFLVAIGFCTIWAFGFGGKGIKCGAIFGFFLGLMGTGGMLINFVFVPIPDQFMIPWALGGILASVIAGVVTSAVYRPKKTPE